MKETIPYELATEARPTDGERQEFSNKRKALISKLSRVPEITEALSNLDQDTVYKLVLTPKGTKLFKDAQGNLKGVFYKNGKIVEHAKFQKVGTSMLKAAKAVGAQVILVSITMQLNRIEEQIVKVLEEFHADRLAEIETGASLFSQACEKKDVKIRDSLISKSLVETTRGFEKTVSALARLIDGLPEHKLSFSDNWGTSKSQQASKKHKIAHVSFVECLRALKIMARCHLLLGDGDRKAALCVIKEGLDKIKNAGVNTALERSRLAPKMEDGSLPEEIWRRFIEHQKSSGVMDVGLAQSQEETIEIEFKPAEIRRQYVKV